MNAGGNDELDDLTKEVQASHFPGRGATLHDACADAWERAKRSGNAGPLHVVDIQIHGHNPLSEYRIIVKSTT
jgi:hypothetical protein